ncbi:MAG TPA: YbaK/EbsC family protein [Arenicellales bacterium]|nr:YbaK/EbsC family protein [Arenicellales bacterium]MDP7218049.1 YbaK/EbsC family protein [Arenicellales bacterium]HJP08509.1 YbaK/EbsC family protein [Arenicellales bacterium]
MKDQHSESSSSDAASATLTALADFGIEHEVLDCDPELADTAVFCEHYGIPLSISANVIVAAGKSNPRQYAACVLLASTRLDVNKSVRKRMGVKKCSFASAEETRALTGMEIGGVTALGLPASLPLWVDSRVMQPDYVILGGGSRSIKIKVSPAVFNLTPNTTIIEGLAVEPG